MCVPRESALCVSQRAASCGVATAAVAADALAQRRWLPLPEEVTVGVLEVGVRERAVTRTLKLSLIHI